VAGRHLLLPERSVLLHIGMYKTGTTAIQGALFQARPHLAEHGVLHAGMSRHPASAVLAFTGRKMRGLPSPPMEEWQTLVDQVAAAQDKRVIVSSEFFGDTDIDRARRAVRELGGSRVHVVVTLRPLAKILPSQWQTYVRNGSVAAPYEAWLDKMLKGEARQPPLRFWRRNHHDVVVEKWASIVGPENLTVIVVDEVDRSFLFRCFEELVGLPAGLIVPERSTENRSLSLFEIELVRQMTVEFRNRGWSDELYRQIVQKGLATQMSIGRKPQADEAGIRTPQWALDRAVQIGAAAVEKICASGVRIVGDISTLCSPMLAEEPHEPTSADIDLAVDAAREAVVGAILSSGVVQSPTVESTSARDLVQVVLNRAWRRALGGRRRAIR
jgi:hypothetical protein